MKKILSKVIVAILLLTIIMSINTPISKTYVSFPSHYAYADTQTSAFVTRFYQLFFNREPDAGGLDYWTNALLNSQKTGAEVSAYFVNGPEFKALNVDDSTYLTMMYRAFFNREPDSSGMAYWQGYLDSGMSRYWVLNNFVISTEFNNICMSYGIIRGTLPLTNPADLYPQITSFVTRFYKLCLNRMPDEGGLNYWVKDLAAGTRTGAVLANDFVRSTEFVNRNVSDSDYITILYNSFFSRSPDTGGTNYWLNKLSADTTRYNVLCGFVNSQEFTNLCQEYGITRGTLIPEPIKPYFYTVMLDKTYYSTSAVSAVFVNNGSVPMRIYSQDARLLDADYGNYDRDLQLCGIVNDTIVYYSWVEIPANSSAIVLFGVVGSNTWYDLRSTITYDFTYDGVWYSGSSSHYYGDYYQKN